jgi:large subunit ribosomal protein L25
MEEIKLSVVVRDGKSTKKQLSGLRAERRLPGIIYGGDKPPVQVALSEKELQAARKRGGANAILQLEMGQSVETVVVKALQRHPVSDRLVHADFQRISMTQKIETKVPLRVVGEAPGVKNSGGILQHVLRELAIRALPKDIPQFLSVDISGLEIGMHVEVKDLKVPAAVEVLEPAGHRVVSVTTIKVVVEETPAVAVPVEGEAAPAEPELVATKGKKDEEGKLIKETVAGAAPAAGKGKEAAKGEKGKEPAKAAERGKAPVAASTAAPGKAAPPAKK